MAWNDDTPAATSAWDACLPDADSDWERCFGPTLLSIDPPDGDLGEIVPVTLTGTGFEDDATVQVHSSGEITVGNVVVVSPTSITADFTIPSDAAAVGVHDVTVTSQRLVTKAVEFTVNDVPPPDVPVATAATNVLTTSFDANWNAATGADDYLLDVATDAGFVSILPGYNGLVVAGLTQAVTGLSSDTDYFYRVRARNGGGTSGNSNTITAHTAIAYLLRDEMVGANGTGITAHSPEVGGAWVAAPGYSAANMSLDGAGDLKEGLSGGFANAAQNDGVSVADVAVEVSQGAQVGGGAGVGFGVTARHSAAVDTNYLLHRNTTTIEVYRVITGGVTLLGSYTLVGAEIPSSSNFVTFLWEVKTVAGNVRHTLWVNSVQRLQITDSSGSKITAAGRLGLRFFKVAGQAPLCAYIRAVAA